MSLSCAFNSRPHWPFRHPRWHKGVVVRPLRFFILSVVKIGGKDQQIALDEYSRLVVFFDHRLTFDLVWSGEPGSHIPRSRRMAGSIPVAVRTRDPPYHRGFGEHDTRIVFCGNCVYIE